MTLLNMVIDVFMDVKLMFWDEVILSTIYIKNKSPSTALHNKTPYEMWHGHLPTIKNFRIFGSTYYALFPEQ